MIFLSNKNKIKKTKNNIKAANRKKEIEVLASQPSQTISIFPLFLENHMAKELTEAIKDIKINILINFLIVMQLLFSQEYF